MREATAPRAPCRVDVESLEDLTDLWRGGGAALDWRCPFVLPPWLTAWWSVLGGNGEVLIAVVRQADSIVGVAPLMIRDGKVRFLGDPDVCDFFDCTIVPGKGRIFFQSLMEYLSARGLEELELGPVCPDSAVLEFFPREQPDSGGAWNVRKEDVLVELDLPATWDEFLNRLDGKQRHELRRKLRRLHEAGRIRLRKVTDMSGLPEAVETFLGLFNMNREDKAAFMTDRMASFFRALAFGLAEENLLRLFFLDVDERPAASVFCFDHRGARYLYNNGYDHAYGGIGVGLMSKVLCLKAAIDEGLQTYNFLRGDEGYKYRLGGKEIPLSRCLISLNPTASRPPRAPR